MMDPRCIFYCAGKGQKQEDKKEKNEKAGKSGEEKQRSGTKCYKAGIITRNPFFNYLRTIRESQCGLSITEIAKYGSEQWRKMSDVQKCPFYMQAHRAKRRKRRPRRTLLIKEEKDQSKVIKKARMRKTRMKRPGLRQMRKTVQFKKEKN